MATRAREVTVENLDVPSAVVPNLAAWIGGTVAAQDSLTAGQIGVLVEHLAVSPETPGGVASVVTKSTELIFMLEALLSYENAGLAAEAAERNHATSEAICNE